jgi:hypothetical protein
MSAEVVDKPKIVYIDNDDYTYDPKVGFKSKIVDFYSPEVISTGQFERDIVIIHAIENWPAKNIAFFKSTGESNSPEFKVFADTFFPMMGCFVNHDDTPIIKQDSSLRLTENYIVKLGGTFPSVRGTILHIPNWMIADLVEYVKTKPYPSIDEIDEIDDPDQLQLLLSYSDDLKTIFTCLSTYFTSIWQVKTSIALSLGSNTGVWTTPKFHDFSMFLIEKYKITEISELAFKPKDESLYNYLKSNSAQCELNLWYKVKLFYRTPILYELLVLYPNHIHNKLHSINKRQKRGGKSKRKRKKQRKLKSRKFKN